jgi:hypothetical protein
VADTVATAALMLALWVSCMAIGRLILPRPAPTVDAGAPATWNRPGLAACVGLGALIALGGWATLLHLPVWVVVGPFMLAGLALAVVRIFGTTWRPGPWPVITVAALTVLAFFVIALVESRVGTKMRMNTCDELRAYLPMVNRLIDTNAINEPWSYRRLQNLGGFTYIQAIPVSVFGDMGIGFAETVMAAVFLAGFFVSTGLRSMWARIAALVSVLVIPVLWIPRINTAPVLALVPLLLGTYAVTSELRVALRIGDRRAAVRWGIAGGLLLAAVASVRTPGVPVAGLTVVLGALTVGSSSIRERLRVLGVSAGIAVAAIAGWLLAAWESVGTPLYPLLPGNANTSVPSERDPHALDSLGTALSHTFKYFNSGTYFWVAVALLVVAVVGVVARKLLPDAPLVVIIAVAVIANMLLFTVSLSMAATRDFGRYVAPMTSSLLVFLFYEALRAADAGATERTSRATVWRLVVIGVTIVCGVAVFSPMAVDAPELFIESGWRALRWSPPRLPSIVYADAITEAGAAKNMQRAVARVDPKHTILAVDRPYLVDYDRYDLPNMDLPGWATPTGTFPFFRGAEAKVAALRKAGFKDLIATIPDDDRCFWPSYRIAQVKSGEPPDSVYARYFVDWTNAVTKIQTAAPSAVTKVGELLVIDLDRASGQLK